MDRKRSVGRIAFLSVMAALALVLGSTTAAMADKDPCTEKCD